MSDSDSRDSEDGVRYKTENVRSNLNTKIDSYELKSNKRKDKAGRYLSDDGDDENENIHKKIKNNPSCDPALALSVNHKTISSRKEMAIGPVLPDHLLRKPDPDETFNTDTPEESFVGPKLPPHLLEKMKNDVIGPELPSTRSESNTNRKIDSTFRTDRLDPPEESVVGPKLPPHLLEKQKNDMVIGPALPSTFSTTSETTTDRKIAPSSNSPEESFVGPKLPPHLLDKKKNDVIGPELPSTINLSSETTTNKNIGPGLPPHLREGKTEDFASSSEDEDTYGPLPSGIKIHSKVHKALEERALQMKIDQLDPRATEEPVRETWMLELPEAKAAHLGLGARQFRSKAGPDLSDRSSWTDIAGHKNKKEKKVDLKAEAINREIQKRDKEQDRMAKKHKKKEKSLVDIHKEKLDQQKQAAGPSERKPFNRETDLQVNRFDEAQKKAVLKKAQLLDDRFSAGKAKYL